MNNLVCTAFILSQPKLKRLKSKCLCYMVVNLYNFRDDMLNLKAIGFAKSTIAKRIFDMYNQKNRVIIEGSIYIKKIQLTRNYNIKSKKIYLKINKIYNLYN
uniref:Single-stranded DNA binding protein n=1 Tax=Gracilariopsis mclachlanii TaxID=486813 RepID=A0A345UA35_9FLOR|nr:hypothetical protein [Gracilariopsis mclachlanii]AXI97321.1 hypothetical protein [Gracilariopsis mclachlanii]